MLQERERSELPVIAQSFFTPQALAEMQQLDSREGRTTTTTTTTTSRSQTTTEEDNAKEELLQLRKQTLKKFSALGKGISRFAVAVQ